MFANNILGLNRSNRSNRSNIIGQISEKKCMVLCNR